MTDSLNNLTIKGFKSIQNLDSLELNSLNVFIGANGAGKSNLIAFFNMLQTIMENNLDTYINRDSGGINNLLFNGRKTTTEMNFETTFSDRGYRFSIAETVDEKFFLMGEARYYRRGTSGWWALGSSYDGTSLLAKEAKGVGNDARNSKLVYNAIKSWKLYQFHDTTSNAGMRHSGRIEDNQYLRHDAANIAPYLLRLKTEESDRYNEIINVIRLVMPYFGDFILQPQKPNNELVTVRLDWFQKGSDYPLQPFHLSDGSLRLICLVTALLQPKPPATLIIDEPELGLHPDAISIIAELIEAASREMQVIIATQSTALVDHFSVEDIVVVNRENGASTFKRLQEKDYNVWLEDYSIGELWRKNIIPTGPNHE